MAVDFDYLVSEAVTLLGTTKVKGALTTVPVAGFSTIGGCRIDVDVTSIRGTGIRSFTLIVEDSPNGSVWSTVHSWTFTEPGTGSFEPSSLQDLVRVRFTTAGGLREATVGSVVVVPARDAIEGGGSQTLAEILADSNDAGGGTINNLLWTATDTLNVDFLDSKDQNHIELSQPLDVNGKVLSNLAAPSAPASPATKDYVDSAVGALQPTSEKAQADGYASLDSGGLVPTAQIPSVPAVIPDVAYAQTANDSVTLSQGNITAVLVGQLVRWERLGRTVFVRIYLQTETEGQEGEAWTVDLPSAIPAAEFGDSTNGPIAVGSGYVITDMQHAATCALTDDPGGPGPTRRFAFVTADGALGLAGAADRMGAGSEVQVSLVYEAAAAA